MPTFLSPLNLSKNELQNARVQNLGSAPGSPVTGQLYYDTGTNKLMWYNGSGWIDATGGGTPADATTGTKGIVQLAGDLAGTAASPQIAAGAVVLADLNAAIKPSGTAATTDEAVRALGVAANNAFPGNGSRSLLGAPTADISWGGFKITNLGTPTTTTDAATKAYVDGVLAGLSWKQQVRAATTVAGTLASSFANASVIDGITLATNDRILIKNQASAQENGIYIVAASGAPTRATDADAWTEVVNAAVYVSLGTVNADTGWVSTADLGGTLNTTVIPWAQFTGAGSFVDGAGLLRTGNTIDVQVDGSSIEINADILRIKALGVTNAMLAGSIDATTKFTGATPVANGGTGQATAKLGRETGLGAAGYYSSATHGAGTTITITQATHGLRSSRGIVVQTQLESDGSVLFADVTVGATGDVVVTFAASQSANTIRVTLIG